MDQTERESVEGALRREAASMSRTVSGKERDALHTVVAEAAAAVSGSSRRRTDAAVAAVAFFANQ